MDYPLNLLLLQVLKFNAALLWRFKGNSKKDLVVLYLGCKYKGYCSDISRAIFVVGITDEEKNVYDIILRANEAGEKMAKQGVVAGDLD